MCGAIMSMSTCPQRAFARVLVLHLARERQREFGTLWAHAGHVIHYWALDVSRVAKKVLTTAKTNAWIFKAACMRCPSGVPKSANL